MKILKSGFLHPVCVCLIIVFVFFVLCSCINIETRISFSEDGSGLFRVKYVLPAFEKTSGQENPLVLSLGLEENTFNDAVALNDNLQLLGYAKIEGNKHTEIVVAIKFNQIEHIGEIESFAPLQLQLIEKRDKMIYKQVINNSSYIEARKGTIKLFEDVLRGTEISFVIETPSLIDEVNAGVIRKDQRSVEVVLPLSTYLFSPDESVFTVEWKR